MVTAEIQTQSLYFRSSLECVGSWLINYPVVGGPASISSRSESFPTTGRHYPRSVLGEGELGAGRMQDLGTSGFYRRLWLFKAKEVAATSNSICSPACTPSPLLHGVPAGCLEGIYSFGSWHLRPASRDWPTGDEQNRLEPRNFHPFSP
jgi:hypothetical protein